MPSIERRPERLFASPRVELRRRADASMILRSPMQLAPYSRCTGDWLVRWSREAPERVFLAERDRTGSWSTLTYRAALDKVRALATGLLAQGLGADRPVAILSDNGIEHALLMLAAMHVGVPAAPISQAYSLMSSDHAKLIAIIQSLNPGAIYVSTAEPFSRALRAIAGMHDATIVVGTGGGALPTELGAFVSFDALLARTDPDRVAQAFEQVQPDTIAKILFTSGSTGVPKGVINTHRMLCSSQQAKAQVWPFLETTPPVIVDWLPWNHTFGGNHDFNMVLRNGGTLYIDAGRPVPGLFDKSLANLQEIAPNIYLNVPRGFDMLVGALQKDRALRERFFSRLQVIFYAAAALPQNMWEMLTELAMDTLGEPVAMVSAWGSTETAPLATDCHFQAERSGVIGLPVPGTELKIVPNGSKQEVRVRGPNVTPGYWRDPELTKKAFDAEGFYCIGDAVRLVDEQHPERGLLFDGRVSEDFKLSSGTWVNTGELRLRGIEALAPIAQDIVVTGHDRDAVGFLIFPNLAACRRLAESPEDAPIQSVLQAPAVQASLREGLRRLKSMGGGSSTYAACALLMDEPASIDAGEITDKGYINQRAVLLRRHALVEQLYSADGNAAVSD